MLTGLMRSSLCYTLCKHVQHSTCVVCRKLPTTLQHTNHTRYTREPTSTHSPSVNKTIGIIYLSLAVKCRRSLWLPCRFTITHNSSTMWHPRVRHSKWNNAQAGCGASFHNMPTTPLTSAWIIVFVWSANQHMYIYIPLIYNMYSNKRRRRSLIVLRTRCLINNLTT